MLRQLLHSLINTADLRRELQIALADDPGRNRTVNAITNSFDTPTVQRAYQAFVEVWLREARQDYYD